MSDPSSENPDIEPQKPRGKQRHTQARNIRLTILLAVLGLLAVAIWYDYKVARVGVDSAYDAVAKLNMDQLTSGGTEVVTTQQVQSALNRQPARTYTEQGYQVEVYSWRSGLPFRTHDYFAVFGPGGQLVTHFKYEIPPKEFDPNKFGDSSLPRSREEWMEHMGYDDADEAAYLAEFERYRKAAEEQAGTQGDAGAGDSDEDDEDE